MTTLFFNVTITVMIIAVLLVIGLCFGSFVNALVWRIHQQQLPKKQRVIADSKLSIAKGRSVCPNCKHTLGVLDLIPVISWLLLRGECRYCRKPISPQYPIVELVTALLFVISYTCWPSTLDPSVSSLTPFLIWLTSLIGLIALLVYDLRWMLLPNRIVFPLIALSAFGVIAQAIFADNPVGVLLNALGGLAIAGGLFYILFQVSAGRWIGGGDVKLGFALGLLLGAPTLAFLMLFSASILGLVATLPGLVFKKYSLSSKIPFGPFLITATILVKLFGQQLIDWYSGAFLYM